MPRLSAHRRRRPIVSPAVLLLASVTSTFSAPVILRGQASPAGESQAAPASAVERSPATRPAAALSANVEVDALLIQLASEDWTTRAAAQTRLVALAEVAEPRLKRAAHDSEDAEVRARCDAALAQIADNRSFGPTLITLHLANVEPRAAYEELARQAGVALQPQNSSVWNKPLPPITIDADRVPLWDVVNTLRDQCGLDLEPAPKGEPALTINPVVAPSADYHGAPTATHGPFRVRATRVTRSGAIDLTTGAPVANEFVVMLMVQGEPKIRVNRNTGVAKVEAAEDENGVSLALSGENRAMAMQRAMMFTDATTARSGGATWWPVMMRLEYPAQGAGRRIARLKGTTSCGLLVRSDTLEVPNVCAATNVTREFGGRSVVVKSCRRVGPRYEVTLGMGNDPAAAMAVMRPGRSGALDGVRLIGPNNLELMCQGTRMNGSKDGMEMILQYAAGPVAQDAVLKLVWQVATDVRDVEIPFEFTDLPMP